MTTIQWKIEKRALKDLLPFPGNPRKISKAGMEKLKNRIEKRGFHDVLKVDTEGIILSGNMRREALMELGVKEVDVKVPSRKLTKSEKEEIMLESNRNDGEWDRDLLGEISEEVLQEVGFESTEIDIVKEYDEDEEDPFDPDEEADKIKEPITKRGDMFKLGDHVLMCGDSTSAEDVEKLMGGAKADLVFSDPPYNMNYKSHDKGGIMNDNMSEEKFIQFCEDFMARFQEATKEGGALYICSGYQSYMPFVYAMKVNGINYAGPIIWVKNSLGMGMNDYRHKHEMIIKSKNKKPAKKKKAQPILYGWNGGRHYFIDTHEEADVWNVDRRGSNTMCHPTQKPLALINRAIKNSSLRGEIVLDLFGGSGSTLIAAEKTGRRAYICELDPKYCDIIIKRWEELTMNKAEKI